RLTLSALFVLAGFGLLAGVLVYRSTHHSLQMGLEAALDTRMAWIIAALELDGLEFEMDASLGPVDAAPHWRVDAVDGRNLWRSVTEWPEQSLVHKQETLVLGTEQGRRAQGTDLAVAEIGDEERNSVAGRNVDAYFLPEEAESVELVLTVGASTLAMDQELDVLSKRLWLMGAVSLAVAVIFFALLIHVQLKPLSRMAVQAGEISPTDTSKRIQGAGGGLECTRLATALNHMLDRLAQGLERERGFASAAAHQLRTPLAQLRLEVEVALRRERKGEEYRESLAGILVDVMKMQQLVLGLLSLAREGNIGARAGKSFLLSDLLAIVEANKWARLEPVAEELRALRFKGDLAQVESAVANVCANAHAYAPGKLPEIFIHEQGQGIVLVVADTGPGVPGEDQEHIFTPLVRLDPVRSDMPRPEGFGLGLSVARATMRALGGDLFCRDRRDGGNGAEFVFLFPYQEASTTT
ncbi:MAG: HAMP domain-containing protein, partial [Desulfovibrio sp.]